MSYVFIWWVSLFDLLSVSGQWEKSYPEVTLWCHDHRTQFVIGWLHQNYIWISICIYIYICIYWSFLAHPFLFILPVVLTVLYRANLTYILGEWGRDVEETEIKLEKDCWTGVICTYRKTWLNIYLYFQFTWVFIHSIKSPLCGGFYMGLGDIFLWVHDGCFMYQNCWIFRSIQLGIKNKPPRRRPFGVLPQWGPAHRQVTHCSICLPTSCKLSCKSPEKLFQTAGFFTWKKFIASEFRG